MFTGVDSLGDMAQYPVVDTTSAAFATHRAQIVGAKSSFQTPFGVKRMVYTDWTASARAHHGIEKFIQKEVLPFYGNTHDHHSVCGHQSTAFREEARQVLAQATNAKLSIGDNEGGSSKDVIIFAGAGATGATNKLVHLLGIASITRNGVGSGVLPVVFVGPFEHHSNLLPWRETGARVLRIQEDAYGRLDMSDLEYQLKEIYAHNPPIIIGAFAAASNVTGVLTDVNAVTALLHKFGALAVWDYATAGPYVQMDMNPPINDDGDVLAKDAIIFSPHKFLGGSNTPGVLVVKKSLCRNTVPSQPGGGTVFFVSEGSHRFLSDRSEREEGGTPDIVGTIRAGLALQLKSSVGAKKIMDEELRISSLVHARLLRCTGLVVLGPHDHEQAPRLPIFSLLVRADSVRKGFFLHYNYVTRVLNDVFGIQARGGCACAGPYAQDLLGMSRVDESHSEGTKRMTYADSFESALLNKNELLRPGFTRLSFPWVMEEADMEYVCAALEAIAEHGWKLLTQYKYDHDTGEWSHKSRLNKFPNRRWISRAFSSTFANAGSPEDVQIDLKEQLEAGIRILTDNSYHKSVTTTSTSESHVLDANAERLRWFVLPSEAREHMRGSGSVATQALCLSLVPKQYAGECVLQAFHANVAETSMNSTTMVSLKEAVMPQSVVEAPVTALSSLSIAKVEGDKDNQPREILATEQPMSRNSATAEMDVLMMKQKLELGDYKGKKNRSKRAQLKKRILEAERRNAGAATVEEYLNNAVAQKRDRKMAKRVVNFDPQDTLEHGATTDSVDYSDKITSGVDQKQVAAKAKKSVERKLMKEMGLAINDWNMIRDGDRVLVAVSGGKDSLTLLHLLIELKRRAPITFDIGAVTVDPGTDAFDPSPLIPYMKKLGVPFFYEDQNKIFVWAEHKNPSSICAFCARMKRGRLYACARREGYNVLALGQHLDDLAESFLMGAFMNGSLQAMKAIYETKEGANKDTMPIVGATGKKYFSIDTGSVEKKSFESDEIATENYTAAAIRVVRPLAYVREHETKEFARLVHLPVINENCPACFEAPKERKRVKKLLAQQESLFPATFKNLRRALIPLMSEETMTSLHEFSAGKLQSGPMHWGGLHGKTKKWHSDREGPTASS